MFENNLINRLNRIGTFRTDYGPYHPEHPDTQKISDLQKVLQKFPFLQEQAADYVNFMERYAGACFSQDWRLMTMDVFGISHEVSIPLLQDVGDTITEDNFMTFSSLALLRSEDQPDYTDFVAVGFGFDSSGNRKKGVYRSIDLQPYEYYCASFNDWLNLFIEHRGYLL